MVPVVMEFKTYTRSKSSKRITLVNKNKLVSVIKFIVLWEYLREETDLVREVVEFPYGKNYSQC